MLLITANWLAKNRFKEMIRSQLTDVRNPLGQTLNQSGRLHEAVLLRGNVSELAMELHLPKRDRYTGGGKRLRPAYGHYRQVVVF